MITSTRVVAHASDTRPLLAICAALSCLTLIASASSSAQQYPNRPLRFVVPYAAGGSADIIARIVSQKMTSGLGQQIVVDNRAGAGGNIGAAFVAKAAPDGYTLLLATNSHAVNATLYSQVDYDLIKDFAPVSLISSTPLILVVHPSLPVRSVKDLIALARSRPGKLFFSSSGNGGSPHMAAQLFSSTADIKLVHVPYRSNTEATTDLLSGQVQLMFSPIAAVLPQIKTAKLRALGITSTRRSVIVPDVPTLAEAGVPGYALELWNGIVAPTGTPKDIISRLHAEILKALAAPDLKERFSSQGVDPVSDTPEEFSGYIKNELTRWRKVVKDSGARVE